MRGSQVYEEPSWKLSYRDDRMVGSKESRFCQELAEPPGGRHPGSGRFGVGWGSGEEAGQGQDPRAPPGPDLRQSLQSHGGLLTMV